MIERHLTQTGTLHRRTSVTGDAEGNVVEDAAADEQVACLLSRVRAREARFGRQVQITEWMLLLHGETIVDSSDAITIGGTTYEIGEPARPGRPGFGEHHVEAPVREMRLEGV